MFHGGNDSDSLALSRQTGAKAQHTTTTKFNALARAATLVCAPGDSRALEFARECASTSAFVHVRFTCANTVLAHTLRRTRRQNKFLIPHILAYGQTDTRIEQNHAKRIGVCVRELKLDTGM